jgi:hypothetical protein
MRRIVMGGLAVILVGLPAAGQGITGNGWSEAYFFPPPDSSFASPAAAGPEASEPGGGESEVERNRAATGNFYFAPGFAADSNDMIGLVHFGGGVEGCFKGSNFGLSLDAGYFAGGDMESISISPGILYQFTSAGNTVPFLKGGYTLLTAGEGSASLIHLGGGLNHWLSDRFGVRFEARDTIWLESPDFQIIEFRAAVVIR